LSASHVVGRLSGGLSASHVVGRLSGGLSASHVVGRRSGGLSASHVVGRLSGDLSASHVVGRLSGGLSASHVVDGHPLHALEVVRVDGRVLGGEGDHLGEQLPKTAAHGVRHIAGAYRVRFSLAARKSSLSFSCTSTISAKSASAASNACTICEFA